MTGYRRTFRDGFSFIKLYMIVVVEVTAKTRTVYDALEKAYSGTVILKKT